MTTSNNAAASNALAEPLLKVEDLVVDYSRHSRFSRGEPKPPAVDRVSFSVEPGSFVALVGESGSGKSSIANAVLGLAPISSGSLQLAGVEIGGLKRRQARAARRAAQLIMQDPFDALDPLCSVRTLVEEPLLIHDRRAGKEARRVRVDEVLTRVGLQPVEEFALRRPHELSGGQRQRVGIASALAVEPRLLIADEPVSMLDVSVRAEILHLLDGIRTERGMGILMITHDLPTALAFCDRVLVMRKGVLVAEGASEEIRHATSEPYTRELLDATPGRLTAAPGDRSRSIDDGPNIINN